MNGFIQLFLLLGCVALLLKPLGGYIVRVYSNQPIMLGRLFNPIEETLYRIAKINPNSEMTWQQYAIALLSASFAGFVLLFLILKYQSYFPLNPGQFDDLSNDLAFNIASSFITNTNWQSYAGETTLSHFSQMFGLTVQNFLSASMGMAVAVALIRGIIRKNYNLIGNFWVDWLRGILYILLPLSLVLALILGSQGVIQNFNSNVTAINLEAVTQSIPGGPVASQVAIKQLGSNGGGFFNANSAHPFENPNALTNFLECLSILLIPATFCYAFGMMVDNRRHGLALLLTMTLIFIPLYFFALQQEQQENMLLSVLPIDQRASQTQSGGNMEGKETRFGIVNSVLWASATTATSNGSVNSMHDSYTPLGGLVPLLFMMLGEIIYGGVGTGLYSIILFVILTVFIAGLMVGRTPEYLGKKIQAFEIKMSSMCIIIPVITILFGSTITIMSSQGIQSMHNVGAQGFSEIIYAFVSASANNGSAFAGLEANTPFYNILLGICMLLNRFGVIVLVLAISGSLAAKNITPTTVGTLSTHSPLFILFLAGIILFIGLLTYIPTLTLAPISEFFHMMSMQ
ncbi:potassium-transporting ATPase subunit KdpA [Candidatus Berkiella aquae]|uniref:Potassium-transporting ATPase potassium-binding subunit n=1 Tax=Candidatus Berkiella aquae TaxID=295108 RepID=A0AAE3L8J8_9GAMM|nr:potassium-transporting ATPase subunit KdpA [Candidatus Berkiella aquae]